MSNKDMGKRPGDTNSEVLLDLFDPVQIRRAILYASIMLIVLMAQDMVFSHIKIQGARPMFAPVFAVASGLFGGGVWGGFFGLVCGFLSDMVFHENTITFTVLFPVIGFTSGLLTQFFVNKRFFSYFFLCAVSLALTASVQALRLWITHGSSLRDLAYTAGIQVLLSLPFTLPVYFPCRALAKKARY